MAALQQATQPYAYIAAAGVVAVLVFYLLAQAAPGPRRRGALFLAATIYLWLAGEVLVAFSSRLVIATWAIRGTYAAIACLPAAILHLVRVLDPAVRRHRLLARAIAAFVAVCMVIVFAGLKYTIGLRVSPTEEIDGLDVHEHGHAGYGEDIGHIGDDVLVGALADSEGS